MVVFSSFEWGFGAAADFLGIEEGGLVMRREERRKGKEENEVERDLLEP